MIKKISVLLLTFFVFENSLVLAKNCEDKNMEKIVQPAGRDEVGNFAPDFAHYNDDILFGENWNNQDIDTKTRSIITFVSLVSQGITD